MDDTNNLEYTDNAYTSVTLANALINKSNNEFGYRVNNELEQFRAPSNYNNYSDQNSFNNFVHYTDFPATLFANTSHQICYEDNSGLFSNNSLPLYDFTYPPPNHNLTLVQNYSSQSFPLTQTNSNFVTNIQTSFPSCDASIWQEPPKRTIGLNNHTSETITSGALNQFSKQDTLQNESRPSVPDAVWRSTPNQYAIQHTYPGQISLNNENGPSVSDAVWHSTPNQYAIQHTQEQISLNNESRPIALDLVLHSTLNQRIIEESSQDQILPDNESGPSAPEIQDLNTGNNKKRSNNSKKDKRQKKMKDLFNILPPCDSTTCKLHCTEKMPEEIRKIINQDFLSLESDAARRAYFVSHITRKNIGRRTSSKQDKTVRNNTFSYFLPNENGTNTVVCKRFFTSTLGYNYNNNSAFRSTVINQDKITLQPAPENRGTYERKVLNTEIRRVAIIEHIESYNPCISHYRRVHAPNRRYLSSELTITEMHNDFISKYEQFSTCKYEQYRSIFNTMNISFTKIGNEQCELCEMFELHDKNHNKNNLSNECDICIKWKTHYQLVKDARKQYQIHAEKNLVASDEVFYSCDLQKVIMLPKMDGFKTAMFTRRIILFNESFVPIGSLQRNKIFTVIWHEAIAGRSKEDIISTFHQFFLSVRDKKKVTLWLDNCSAQNKNWAFLTFLIYLINSDEIETDCIEIFYFESGHTYMSADSFHHQVELSMKKKGNIYDFDDFVDCVESANSKGKTKAMSPNDFRDWSDHTSSSKINRKNSPRPNLNDIKQIKFDRGNKFLLYKTDFSETNEYRQLDFLLNRIIKTGISKPDCRTDHRGIPPSKKQDIISKLVPLMPKSRKQFWIELPENNVSDLINSD